MDEIFTLTNGSHFNGSAQTVRLIRDIVLIALCLYEITVKRRNGIITAIIIIVLGDIVNAVYSVMDSISLIFPVFAELSSSTNLTLRGWTIGAGVWIANFGWLMMFIYLWIMPDKRKK
jgi:hypothetical protein